MDEESDQFLGEVYPYTYATHNRLLKKLFEDKPEIISYMVPMMEPENEIDKENLETFHSDVQKFKIANGIFRFGTDKDAWGEQIPPEGLADLGYSLGIINKEVKISSHQMLEVVELIELGRKK